MAWCSVRSPGWNRSSRENRADSRDRWKRALKAWLSELDRAALMLETWVLAKEKRHRRWERAPDAAKATLQQEAIPLSVTQLDFPNLCPFLLSPGSPGSEEGWKGDKLVAWPLSHLLLAAFQEC